MGKHTPARSRDCVKVSEESLLEDLRHTTDLCSVRVVGLAGSPGTGYGAGYGRLVGYSLFSNADPDAEEDEF